ncbi:MAG TPA: DUF3276 family protein [Bacteroidales bacterium]|nr:DUF3276 family protein [Bacteroidales bacterium]
MSEQLNNEFKEDAYSKSIRAGKRTYFFDVKVTKTNDYFLTITESKRVFQNEGQFSYEKHKIFLYREDFEKFMEGLQDAFQFVTSNKQEEYVSPQGDDEFNDIQFDDLHSNK